jgi:hypothetical protein
MLADFAGGEGGVKDREPRDALPPSDRGALYLINDSAPHFFELASCCAVADTALERPCLEARTLHHPGFTVEGDTDNVESSS